MAQKFNLDVAIQLRAVFILKVGFEIVQVFSKLNRAHNFLLKTYGPSLTSHVPQYSGMTRHFYKNQTWSGVLLSGTTVSIVKYMPL